MFCFCRPCFWSSFWNIWKSQWQSRVCLYLCCGYSCCSNTYMDHYVYK
jgi:hypothetical protein